MGIDSEVNRHGQQIRTQGYSLAEGMLSPSLMERVRSENAPLGRIEKTSTAQFVR